MPLRGEWVDHWAGAVQAKPPDTPNPLTQARACKPRVCKIPRMLPLCSFLELSLCVHLHRIEVCVRGLPM
jgi:hypothetical protein